MRKARNKKLSLLMALVFMFTVVFPVGAAFAGDYATFNSAYKYVTTGKDVTAGTASAVYKDNGTATEFFFEVTLPDGVEYANKPINDTSKPADFGNYITATSLGTVTFESSNPDSLKVKATNWSTGSKITFNFNTAQTALNIDKDITGNVDVQLEAVGVNSSDNIVWAENDDLTIAKAAGDDITIKAGALKKVSAGGNKAVAKITVEESQAGSIDDTGLAKVKFIIETDDVEFSGSGTTPTATPSGQDGIGLGTITRAQDSDNNYTIVEAAINTSSTTFPGTISFTPKLDISPNVDDDIEITVEVYNAAGNVVEDKTVTVATVGDVSIEVEDLEDNDNVVYAGQTKELDVTFTLTTTDGSEFAENDVLTFELSAGKFDSVPTVTSAGSGTVKRYDDNKAFYYTCGSGEDDELDIKDIKVSLKNDAEPGDITLTIGGDYGDLEEIVIATAAKPYTITADKPSIMAEALSQEAGEITITEANGGAMKTTEFVYVELPSGVQLSGKPKIEVTEGGGDAKIAKYDDDYFVIEVTKKSSSSKPTTFRVYNVKYDTGKLALAGDVELKIYGDVANTTPGADKYDFKDDSMMTSVVNATVVDGNVVTASYTLGDAGVAIQNGRTLVQVNTLCETLGLQKSWDATNKIAYFIKSGTVVAFPIGQNQIIINGNTLPVDQGGVIIDGYTYATLRGIQAAFGGDLDWDNETKTATFSFNK